MKATVDKLLRTYYVLRRYGWKVIWCEIILNNNTKSQFQSYFPNKRDQLITTFLPHWPLREKKVIARKINYMMRYILHWLHLTLIRKILQEKASVTTKCRGRSLLKKRATCMKFQQRMNTVLHHLKIKFYKVTKIFNRFCSAKSLMICVIIVPYETFYQNMLLLACIRLAWIRSKSDALPKETPMM